MNREHISYEQEKEVDRLLALANLQRIRNQWADAEDTCRKVLALSPNDIATRELHGDILRELGKLEMARDEYHTALGLAPGKPSLETKYAKVTLELAEREHEKLIAQDMINNPKKYIAHPRNQMWAIICAAIAPGFGQLYKGQIAKAAVIFGTFLLFVIVMAVLQPFYIDIGRLFTNPLVLILGLIAVFAYIYGIIDASTALGKADGNSKKRSAP